MKETWNLKTTKELKKQKTDPCTPNLEHNNKTSYKKNELLD